MHLCNYLNQNEYEIIIMLIPAISYFLFIKNIPPQEFITAEQVLGIPSSNLNENVRGRVSQAVWKCIINSWFILGNSL